MKATGETWMMINMMMMMTSSKKVTRGTESSYKKKDEHCYRRQEKEPKIHPEDILSSNVQEKKKTGVLDKRQEAEPSRACYSKNLHNKAVIWQTSA